jgi:RNA polymerase sigma-70 factor (ECF subfamily)
VEEIDWLAQRFEIHRTRLRAVANRMLGSVSEADDAERRGFVSAEQTPTPSRT